MNHLLQQLLLWFMFAGTQFFAAGAVADLTGAGDGQGSGDADAGAAESGSDGALSSGDGDAGTDAGTDEAAAQSDGAQADADKIAQQDQKLDGRGLPPKVKELMDGLQKADPKAHGWLKDRLYRDRQFTQEFPQGLAEAKSYKEALSTLREAMPPELAEAPAAEIIGAVREELSEGRALDELFAKGDPKLFERMIEFSPEGFKKLLPAAVNQYSRIDPEGYQHTMAGVLYNTLQNANVLNTLGFVNRLLAKGDTAGAIEELKSIAEWASQVGELAKAKPAADATKNPAADGRQSELDQREMKLWIDETARPINTAKTNAIKAELKQYLKGQAIDDETYAALENQCLIFLNDLLKADPNFAPTFNRYVENKDRAGITKYMESRLKELLPSRTLANGEKKMGPVERAHKLFFRGTSTAKPKPGQQQAKPGQQQQKAAPKGWERISADKAPQPYDIDRNQTSFEMSFQKAAILKNGKKVFWGEQAPA